MRIPSLFAVALLAMGQLLPVACVKAEEGYARAVAVTTVLKTSADSAGQAIHYPTNRAAEVTGVLVEIPAGQRTGWHRHPAPCVAYVLEGQVTVELENGRKTTYRAGDAFAEVVNLKHCGENTGATPVKILMVCIGAKGSPLSEKTEP